jgi:hypothetical protein
MRGAPILIIFFVMFTSASLLIPSPMFPGNAFCLLIGGVTNQYAALLSALFNGAFYGVILWSVFAAISRRFEEK